MLLDQDGFECDPINRRDGDTPLHCAVRWVNELPEAEKEEGAALIEMMIEAGSDARYVNQFLEDAIVSSSVEEEWGVMTSYCYCAPYYWSLNLERQHYKLPFKFLQYSRYLMLL